MLSQGITVFLKRVLYLFSIAAITIYHKLSSLKQNKFILSQFVGQELRLTQLVLCCRSHKAELRVVAAWAAWEAGSTSATLLAFSQRKFSAAESLFGQTGPTRPSRTSPQI